MSDSAVSTSKWDAADYARVGSFVAELGQAALDLLDPKPGERILDVGCGEGSLTWKIAKRGAAVTGIDNSLEMINAARAAGLDVLLLDAAQMKFESEFDAAFSNAALHWMLDKEQVAAAVFRALKPGGRFAGEMGGQGNIARLQEAVDEEMILRGYVPPADGKNWYPSPEGFAAVYEAAGFVQIDARSIAPLARCHTKMSELPFVSLATRFDAADANATVDASVLITGPPLPSCESAFPGVRSDVVA